MHDQSSFYTLLVEGMSCKHCEAAVTEAARSVPGVTEAKVNLEDGKVAMQGGKPDAVSKPLTRLAIRRVLCRNR
ncbi:MAG: cation transporter [Candidatus Electrothrix sp. YB6]